MGIDCREENCKLRNTTTDGLNGLQITYNILNLPQSVTQSGTTKATYGWFADGSGSTIEQNAYYPFGGRHTFGQTYAQTTANRYKFNGKELQTTGNLSLLDYGARMYDTKTARWLVQDPLAEKYYPFSAYNYCVNNPVMLVDTDGRDWYSYQEEIFNDENQQMFVTKYAWTTAKSQTELNATGVSGTYLGEAVVLFNGFVDERLGVDGKLTGEGAKPANVTIYGINGENDIKSYLGLTVSSDPQKYSMIQEGDYHLFYEQMATSVYGKNSLTYRVSELDGNLRLNPEGGINKHNGKTFMEGIFLHRTNKDGAAQKSS